MALKLPEVSPESVGVDSWGVDFVLLDEEGELVDAPIAYRDSRTEGMQELWKTLMSDMETFERTGINFYIFNTLFQLLSLKDSKELERTSRILFIPCYISYLLTGKAQNELSIASTSQMLGVNENKWDELILEKLQLNGDLLGEVLAPGSRLGPVSLPGFKKTGMEGIAVCGHDTACVVAAIPVENPNYAYISAGTWCIVGIESDRPLISREALDLGLTNERGYNHTYRTLKNIVGLWLLQGLKKHLPGDTTFSEMEEMTREGGPILQVIDPDDPLFYNPEDMKEAFDSYFERTDQSRPDTFSDYLLCAYDSLCFSFRYHVEKLEELSGKTIEVLHLVGGGSQSAYLNQRIASICNRHVVSGPVEGATLGNILIQALALGRIDSLEQGRSLVKKCCPVMEYDPLPASKSTSKRYEHFLQLKQTTNS
jgi:sugar (pentulose or hexulose) kinase